MFSSRFLCSYFQMRSSVNSIKLSHGAPTKKQETVYGRHSNLTLYSQPPFILSLCVILRHILLSNVISVSLARLLPSSVSRYCISLSLHLSVFLSIPLDLSIISPLSPFSLSVPPSRQPAVGEEEQRMMFLRQKYSSALPLSHE